MAQAALMCSSHTTFVCWAAQEVWKGQTRGHPLISASLRNRKSWKHKEGRSRVLTIKAKKPQKCKSFKFKHTKGSTEKKKTQDIVIFEDQRLAIFSNPPKIVTSLKDREWLWKAKPRFQAILRSTPKVYPRNCFLPTQISQLNASHGV